MFTPKNHVSLPGALFSAGSGDEMTIHVPVFFIHAPRPQVQTYIHMHKQHGLILKGLNEYWKAFCDVFSVGSSQAELRSMLLLSIGKPPSLKLAWVC